MLRASALVSTHPRAEVAAGELLGGTLERLGQAASFVLVAAAGAHRARLAELLAAVDDLLAPDLVVGVTTSRLQAGSERWRGGDGGAFGVLGIGSLPISAHHLDFGVGGGVSGLPSLEGRDLVVLGDAATASLGAIVAEVGAGAPDAALVGGLLSAGPLEGTELWIGDRVHRRGAIALAVARPILAARGVQGLRRLGGARTITEVDGSVVVSIDGEPAMDILRRDLAALERPPRSAEALVLALDRRARPDSGSPVRRLGEVLDLGSDLVGPPILGLEPERRGLALGGDAAGERRRLDWLRPGTRVCFAEDNPKRIGPDLAPVVPPGEVALAMGDTEGLDALPQVADRFDAILGVGAPVVFGPVGGSGDGPRPVNGAARLSVAALSVGTLS